jgi:hypothetical protein
MEGRQMRRPSPVPCTILLALALLAAPAAAQRSERRSEPPPTLGLNDGFLSLETPDMRLRLVRSSQTVAALQPKGAGGFDFTPSDWLERRAANGFYHLGDLTLRWRSSENGPWHHASTATHRQPVAPLQTSAPAIAAANLAATLPADLPLEVLRFWEVHDDHLTLRFQLRNRSDRAVEIGALGIPMVFNNILHERSLDQAHVTSSFYDPYIGADAGYVQVTRLHGHGPVLLVIPHGDTPLEAYNPLSSDSTRRGITFEGFYEWMAHSRAYAEDEWSDADPWNPPTSVTLAPGARRSYGVRFVVAPAIREIESTLLANGRPVAVGIPGYVLPDDLHGRLFLKHDADVRAIDVHPAGALTITPDGTTEHGWRRYEVRGTQWGRARVTVRYADDTDQTLHYKVIKSAPQVASDLGDFLTTAQWFDDTNDPFDRAPSVISYDYEKRAPVTEDNRAWIAGLGDEGGSGSWLAAIMKQLVQSDPAEIDKLETFVDSTLWGGLQYADGAFQYGVRKSLFYYEPDHMPAGTYSEETRYGGWSSWTQEHARTVGRSYNYPPVAAAHWVLYRLARNRVGLVTNHPWEWYLERAYQTGVAMTRFAPDHAQFGQMEGTIFLMILEDLQREGWNQQAAHLEAIMKERADEWQSLGYPYGSEMPWDSTGQEEVYAWCKYFGYDEKALVTLNAILAYMPTVPHWGYNGSARRYWDFIYAGKLRRLERQLHHYGSGLNAIPVLSEYRDHPDDFYLLRVGYGGLLGSIANVTPEGFGPSGFHAYPSTLAIDGYSGDYGPGFFGHAVNTGTYLVRHDEFGWLAFGGNVTVEGSTVQVRPLDSGRARLYVAPLGLWITLDAGTIERVELTGTDVRLTLRPATRYTPDARLRLDQPASIEGVGAVTPASEFTMARGAYVVPLSGEATTITLELR